MLHLQKESHAIACAIRANKDRILSLWVKRASLKVDAAQDVDRLVLVDHLPEFLDHLANALDPLASETVREGNEICRTHGHERAIQPSYEVQEVLKEYRLLRESIYDVLEVDGHRRLQPKIRDYLASSIERAMEEAAKAFFAERTNGIRSEMADSLAERQNRYIATVSHDLRSPLGTALMGLELLEEDLPVDETTSGTVEIVRRNLKRAETMLKDLLDVARFKSGYELQLNLEKVDLSKLIKEAAADLKVQYGDRFQLVLGKQVKGQWDPSILRRVLDNLATNAVKYGQLKSPITIFVGKSDSYATLEVKNEGDPIPKDAQTRLFEPFARAYAEDARNSEGWGVGLSFVKMAVETHGGNVGVKCSNGFTKFSIHLPMLRGC